MLSRIATALRRVLIGTASTLEYRDKLCEARSKLDEETKAMQRDIDKVGNRPDPIGTVIRNIKQVRGDD